MTAVPLLPNQIWFLETLHDAMVHPGRWTLGKVYRLDPAVTERVARAAVTAVWAHHDSLRARFRRVDGTWRQEIAEPGDPAPFRAIDLSLIAPGERAEHVEQFAHDVAASLSVTGDQAIRFAYLSPGADGAPRLVLVAHHLVLDYFSLGVLAADLAAAMTALCRAGEVRLPRAAGFAQCVEALHEFAARDLVAELDYWAALPWRDAVALPAEERPEEALRLSRTHSRRIPLGSATAEPAALALGLVGAATTGWAGGPVWFKSLHHGRDLVARDGRRVLPPRAWRTVGWFATAGLRLLPQHKNQDLASYLREVADDPPAPNHGLGLSLLRWLVPATGADDVVGTIWSASQVLYDYASPRPAPSGVPGAVAEAAEAVPGYRDLTEPRLALHVHVRNLGDALSTHWDYDPTSHPEEGVRRLASRAADLLDRHTHRTR
ncbi:MAG: hypothetical protein HOV94_15605 [Saccharothrix sp.]|nr:hypothetical protein [Saccharothrix sp.]